MLLCIYGDLKMWEMTWGILQPALSQDASIFLDDEQSPQPTQNFCVYSEFLSFFVLYSRVLADFLSHLGKWVKLIKFEAENEFFCTLKAEKPQSATSTP